MPLTLSEKKDKHISTTSFDFIMIRIAGINRDTSVDEVITLLLSLNIQNSQLVLNPIPSSWAPMKAGSTFYALTPNIRLNTLFGSKATFAQQLLFLSKMGLPDSIERRPDFYAAVEFFKFIQKLKARGIDNPEGLYCEEPLKNIRRIHLVHPAHLEDPEISAGLHISVKKIKPHDQVFFVCNMASLRMALTFCENHSTLIIDGHWSHGLRNDYGVWSSKNTEEISDDIQQLVDEFPDKIASIRLLGCHSGKLSESELLESKYSSKQFIFKDEVLSDFVKLEMSMFRNRAVFLSREGETPFASDSLAAQIYKKISHRSIRLTASPSYSYPYPAGVPISEFNIGADSSEWNSPPAWNACVDERLPWVIKLLCLKSLTVIQESLAYQELDRASGWLIKSNKII